GVLPRLPQDSEQLPQTPPRVQWQRRVVPYQVGHLLVRRVVPTVGEAHPSRRQITGDRAVGGIVRAADTAPEILIARQPLCCLKRFATQFLPCRQRVHSSPGWRGVLPLLP